MVGQPNSPDVLKYNLRLATEEDVDVLLEMGRKFYATTPFARLAEYNEDAASIDAFGMIDNGYLIVAEHVESGEVIGMLGALYAPLPFTLDKTIAVERMFWIEPEHRGTTLAKEMLAVTEAAMREEGAEVLVLSSLSTSPTGVDKLYRFMGYQQTESSYMKEL
jgi:RimJ/RimL family protein N-acetyltransferase